MTRIEIAVKESIYQKHTTQCTDEEGNIGDFYYTGIYPTNYKRISPTFNHLSDLFKWRNKQLEIK